MAPRLAIYGATSTALAAVVIGSAVHSRPNFFAAAVAVGRSSGSLMVLANFALFNAICIGIGFKRIFFGQLRSIEYEHLFERLWLFLTESLLALTIFRDDFSAAFAFMYGLLLFLKCFHWITADRVDYMDQIPPPGPPPSFHVRISTIIAILTIADLLLVIYSLESITIEGISSMVLFASEFMILLASIAGTSARYLVGLIDLRRARGREDAPSWEEKSMYLFYVDLAVDFVKLLTYLSFFTVILLHYGLPLHILRDVYMTLRSFISRCSDLIRYRRATRDMDALYPDATDEEMERLGDRTCIICREEMIPQNSQAGQADGTRREGGDGPNETPKKLGCGHIFHFHCLRSWLERQQSCPTCRRDVLRTPASSRTAPRAPPVGVAAAPPPAPGAAPQPHGNQAGQPGQVNGNPNPLQALYDDFFRLPGAQRQQPPHHPHPQPTPTTTANGPGSAAPTGAVDDSDELHRIQTGIWGGPITPGRFFPSALGAGPSRPSNLSRTPSAQPSTSRPPFPSLPSLNSQTNQQTTASTITSPNPPNVASMPSSTSLHTPSLISGATTPFSSNPPQVFSPTGTHRRLTRSQTANTAASTSDVQQDQVKEGEMEKDMDGEDRELTEVEKRRQAAEAAMRRLGLAISPSSPIHNNSPSLRIPETDQRTSVEQTNGEVTLLDKGKGVAVESHQAQVENLETPPRFVPYLSSDLPPPHPQTISPWARPPQSALTGLSLSGTSSALEERIETLRDVDERIYRLMGELTQLRSRWESQDATSRPSEGPSGLVQPEGSDDQRNVLESSL